MMKLFAVLSLLLAVAAATPVDINGASPALAKRDTEIVYLADCKRVVSCCEPESHSSQIMVRPNKTHLKIGKQGTLRIADISKQYYSNSKASQSNQAPEANNRCTVVGNNWAWWEGPPQFCKFPTGVTFKAGLDHSARNFPVGTWAGYVIP